MNKIWANQLIADTMKWAEMPASRRPAVKDILLQKLESGEISAEKYEAITGEAAPAKDDPDNE